MKCSNLERRSSNSPLRRRQAAHGKRKREVCSMPWVRARPVPSAVRLAVRSSAACSARFSVEERPAKDVKWPRQAPYNSYFNQRLSTHLSSTVRCSDSSNDAAPLRRCSSSQTSDPAQAGLFTAEREPRGSSALIRVPCARAWLAQQPEGARRSATDECSTRTRRPRAASLRRDRFSFTGKAF